MLSIRTTQDLNRALDAPLEPYLRHLLTLRRDQLVGDTGLDLGEFMHAIVVRVGDTLAQIEAEAGVPIATNLVDGKRFGDAEFESSFDYVRRNEGWLEAVMILTDDGFAFVLLVPDLITIDPSITLLLRRCVAA